MEIIVVGLNHLSAPVEIREKLAISEAQLREALIRLKSNHGIHEGMILSTCNRVEVCAVVHQVQSGFQRVREFFEDLHPGLPAEKWAEALYLYSANEGIQHIFRVASSLDSMVIGEPQILGQFKDAFHSAMNQKATGVILNKVLRKAISVAKRVRTETKIAENAVSVSYAAVELAKKVLGSLEGKEAMLVGAGEMAELAVRHLLDNGVTQVKITTRNFDHAIELAREFNGIPVRFEEFPRYLAQADILICSTAAPHYLITEEHINEAIDRRQNRPAVLIDISVPRNIDPKVNQIDNVYLYNIDDLKDNVETNLQERQRESLKAEEIVSEELMAINKWLKSLEVVPTITALKAKAEEIRRAEISKFLSKRRGISAEDQEIIEGLTACIINKLLHAPLVVLKDEAHSSNGAQYVEAVRRLFNLDKDLSRHSHSSAPEGEKDSEPDEKEKPV